MAGDGPNLTYTISCRPDTVAGVPRRVNKVRRNVNAESSSIAWALL